MKKILNVAEKPSAAKKIASILSRGALNIGHSLSKFNPVYEFKYKFKGQDVLMNFTSVAGHVVGMAFEEKYSRKYWNSVPQEHLFKTAKILKEIAPEKKIIADNLKHSAKNASGLILWLDCDREGEAIAYEVLRICQEVKPDLEIFRAQFSALTDQDVANAMENLRDPDPNLADAVESRSEIDLRIGAAFTRYQTTLLRSKIPQLSSAKVISYGPCQFPTLGFVVERWKKIQNFVSQPFWYISVKHTKVNEAGKEETVTFLWDRDNIFEKEEALKLFNKCKENPQAKIISVMENSRQKYRPVPLSTVALQKIASSKLKLSSHKTMEIAEKLYNKGFISYPRTETDFFPRTMSLEKLIHAQRSHPIWASYAVKLLEKGGFEWPRTGKKDDKAHPPIHPVKVATENGNDLSHEEWLVYELVTRHFLASCSKDAKGFETVVKLDINGEQFHAKGLIIKEENWLEIYPYDKWSGSILPKLEVNESFIPQELKLKESKTTPPALLSEQELINCMDQNGIGTDATIHEHIKTIQDRNYVEKEGMYFKPTKLGEALVEGYEATGTDLWKPYLRASMEENMTQISKGNMKKEEFLDNCLSQMKEKFIQLKQKEEVLLETVKKHFERDSTTENKDNSSTKKFPNISEIKCYKCGKTGHYANFCNNNGNPQFKKPANIYSINNRFSKPVSKPKDTSTIGEKEEKKTEQKVCSVCGHVGRHPRGSTCSAVKRKSIKKEANESSL